MGASSFEFTPVWKMPSQARAIDILRTCRAWTDGVVSGLTSAERTVATPLGDGTWSVKDLLGHLATHEHRALVVMGARRPAGDQLSSFDSVASFNDHHLAKKRSWSLKKVETDYAATRDELVAAIDATTDDRWIEKVPHGAGRSWLGLALGKMLNGDKYGYFAHDFAHRRGLERAAEALRQRRS